MKTRVLLYGLVGVTLGVAPVRAESVPMKPGEYQVTAVTDASNGEAGKPDTRTRCVREEHLANPDAVFNYYALNGFQPNPSSKVVNVSMHGGKVTISKASTRSLAWRGRCLPPGFPWSAKRRPRAIMRCR